MEASSRKEGQRVTERGLGLAVAMPPDVIAAAATAVQDNAYHSFWLNNPPQTDALSALGAIAPTVPRLWLGVGVIPLSTYDPAQIIQRVRDNNLPLERFYLGIGSGSGTGGVERVAQAVGALRTSLQCRIAIAALGPRMCRLAGTMADEVLFNWLTPSYAATSVAWVRESAAETGRPAPRLMAYVRVALGDDAKRRLEGEARNYERIPSYASHFKRMGVDAMGTAITASSPEEIQNALSAWDGLVDEIVVRAITANDTAEDVTRLVEAARPAA